MDGEMCKICLINPASDINSHFTPAAITRSTYGRRNLEDIYSIDTFQGIIENYKGREHPNAKDIILLGPHVSKKIFCKKCEEDLSKIESFQNELVVEVEKFRKGKYKTRLNERHIKYIEVRIPHNILVLLFYSIIWRQCLQQKLINKDTILNQSNFENLRKIIDFELRRSVLEIKSSKQYECYPKIEIVLSSKISSSGWNNPNSVKTNPELFFVSDFMCLFWQVEEVTQNMKSLTRLPREFQTPINFLEGQSNSRILVMNASDWVNIKALLTTREAKKMLDNQVKVFSKTSNLPMEMARKLLLSKAGQILKTTGGNLYEAINQVLNSNT